MLSETEARATAPDEWPPSAAWEGWRPFVIDSRHDESAIITSFILRPQDGSAVPPHRPGQHLTLQVAVPGQPSVTRNYTISAIPNGETLRISVKREPSGRVSNWLHDHAKLGTVLHVMAPSGAFVLPDDATRPLVLLSGGVGVTPMVSMLEAISRSSAAAPVLFVHCTHDGQTHAFGAHVRALAAGRADITISTFYSHPQVQDAVGDGFDHTGRLDMAWLLAHSPVAEADYFICGPLPFMRTFMGGLAKAGVPTGRIHTEFFGDVEDLTDEDLAPSDQANVAGQGPQRTAASYGGAGATIGRPDVANGLLDSASDAVVARDRNGRIVFWNPGAERIFGFSTEEAVGQSLDIIIPEPFRARHWDGYHQTVASGESRYGAGDLLAVPGLCKDGRKISIEFTIVLLKGTSGRVEGMASSIRDVSRRFDEMKALRKQIAEMQQFQG
ncbi:MAG: PAS domain S-box protein [Pseudomonadota bacterium]